MNFKRISILLSALVVVLIGLLVFSHLKYSSEKAQTTTPIEQPNPETEDKNENTNPPVPTQPVVTDEKVVTQTKSPINTVNWKTYTNNKYGFSARYPQNWYVVDASEGALSVSTSEQCKTDNVSTEQLIEQYKQCERFTIWAGDTSSANYGTDDNTYEINIDGQKGVEFIYNLPIQSTLNGQPMFIPVGEIEGQVSKNGIFYKYSLKFHQGNIIHAMKFFDSFMSTVKFAKK